MSLLFFVSVLLGHDVLEKALAFYQSPQFCEIKMSRSYISELLQTEKQSEAILFRQGKKFRLEQIDNTKNVLIFDGVQLWVLEYESASSSYPEQISRSRSQAAVPQVHRLLDFRHLKDHFNIKQIPRDDNRTEFLLSSKNKKKTLDVQNITVEVEANKLVSLSYSDEIGNKSTYRIQSITCKKSGPKGLFNFAPKDESAVIEL